MTLYWQSSAEKILSAGPVMPVLVIEHPDDARPIAEALLEGGIRTLEITLRTRAALDIISQLREDLPEAMVGAGTIASVAQLQLASEAGARFLISPGLTPALLDAAVAGSVPLIPGISTLSEAMTGMEYGLSHFKFFPAEAAGGTRMLRSIAGPFPNLRFCPTGGVNADNAGDYLSLPNVSCVGGSWLVSPDIIAARDWGEITRRARASLALISPDN